MGTIPVYNIQTDYGAVGSGNLSDATTNTNAINNAIAAASSAGGGIVYVPPSTGGFVVNNGHISVASPNVVLAGAGGMGNKIVSGSATGFGASTIIGNGGGHTITILPGSTPTTGCVVRDLAFMQYNGQGSIHQSGADAFVRIQDSDQTSVKNVHMQSPNIGISLFITPPQPPFPPNSDGYVGGEYWIQDVLMEGNITGGGITANVSEATLYLNHVIMVHFNGNPQQAPQPAYGIQVLSAGEVLICNGTDINNMGNCLDIEPGNNTGQALPQKVVALFASDSFFDSGTGSACVFIRPVPNQGGFVSTAHFSNVWASSPFGNNSPTNGFGFFGSGLLGTAAGAVQDVSLVNCVGKGFALQAGLYASGVNALSVTSSTFGGNFNGIRIAPGMNNFALTGNKCGNYTPQGGNTNYGILIESGSTGFVSSGNVCYGNATPYFPTTTTGPNVAIVNNLPG